MVTLSLDAGFDPGKKFFRIKLNGDCVLRMKLPAGSVQTQKSLITTCKLTAQIAPSRPKRIIPFYDGEDAK
jgi:hypothetical protein